MPRIRECVSHGCLRQHRHVAAGLTAYGSVKVPPVRLSSAELLEVRSTADSYFWALGTLHDTE